MALRKFVMNGCAEFLRYNTSITLLKWKGFVIEKSPSIQKPTSKSIPVCMHLSNLYDWDLNAISSSFSDSIGMTFRRFLAVGEIPGRHYPRTIYMYLCPRRSVRNSLNCQLSVHIWSSKWRQNERLQAIYLSTFIFVVSL